MITLVAGARPNFVKIAPIVRELERRNVPFRWIHTGQHTEAMSDPIVRELELPRCDLRLHAAGSHAEMTAKVMVGVEADLVQHRPDWLVVVGDVNSTLGAALAAVKLGVRIAHVEAGYRSHDWTMPEEVNRVLVDRMSDLLLLPDDSYGVSSNATQDSSYTARLQVVGNVMMDSLRWALDRVKERAATYIGTAGTNPRISSRYAILTCHRPMNVDRDEDFVRVEQAIRECPFEVIWPVHPRAARHDLPRAIRIDPLGYLDMVALLRDASVVITDSGGLLEEALYLGKKITCLRDPEKNERQHLLERGVPEIWKTDAAPRIVEELLR